MNYTPFLVFAFALLLSSPLVPRETTKWLAKLTTIMYWRGLTILQDSFTITLMKFYRARPTVVDRKACFDAIDDMPRTYYWTLLLKDGDSRYFYSSPSPTLLHQRECEMLNLHVRRIELVKTSSWRNTTFLLSRISLNLLDSSKSESMLKQTKSEVLRIVRDKTELIRAHFDDIKTCLRDGSIWS